MKTLARKKKKEKKSYSQKLALLNLIRQHRHVRQSRLNFRKQKFNESSYTKTEKKIINFCGQWSNNRVIIIIIILFAKVTPNLNILAQEASKFHSGDYEF